MSNHAIALLVTFALSLLCVVAEYLLKRASLSPQPFASPSYFIALAIFAASAAGWVFVLQHLKLAVAGAIYSIIVVSLLALLGVAFFEEKLRPHEVAGLFCAVASLVLLSRFA